MLRVLSFCMLSVCLLITGCGRNCCDTALYQSSGVAKPVVAVLPVIDRTESQHLGWDLSQEFTQEIQRRLFGSSKLYFLRSNLSKSVALALNVKDPKFITKADTESLGAAEFAIVTELLEQTEKCYMHPSQKHEVLGGVGGKFMAALRLRVLDLRGDQPKVILQEVIDAERMIPWHCYDEGYETVRWKQGEFDLTPMGLLHQDLVDAIIARTEGYVGVAKG